MEQSFFKVIQQYLAVAGKIRSTWFAVMIYALFTTFFFSCSIAFAQNTVNLALNKAATASSAVGSNNANLAVDGNENTRWESNSSDPQWLQVDLGVVQSISRVRLVWENAYGKDYEIQVSDNGTTWSPIQTVTNNNTLINDFAVSANGRYVRVYGTVRGTGYGYSLFELGVYGIDNSPVVSLSSPANNAIYNLPTTILLSATANAASGRTISQVEFYNGTTLLGSTTTAPYTFTWGNPTLGTHTITAKAIDNENAAAFSSPVTITVNALNIALNRPAVASTTNNNGVLASNAFDGNLGTRWESQQGVDSQWLYVDLGDIYSIERVKLTWETAYASNFRIEVSNDASTWTTIASETNPANLGNNLVNDLTGLVGSGRYIRMYGVSRSTQYGYSLWEFEVNGSSGPSVIEAPAPGVTYTAPGNLAVSINAASVTEPISKIELVSDNIVLDTRTTEPFTYTVSLTDLAAGNYNLYARIYDENNSVTNSSVVPVYVVPATSGAFSCGEPVILTASGGTYRWYTVPVGGTPIANTSGTTYTTPILNFTTTYYVAAVSPEGEESQRTPVTANFNSLAQVATTGLTSSYPFNGNPLDATGQGNNGIVHGAILVADRYNRPNSAYSFDGVGDYITTSTSFPTNIEGTNVFSLSLWFKTNTAWGGKMLGLGTSQTGPSSQYDRHIYMTNSGQVVFGIYLDTHKIIKSPEAFNDNEWHHVVATLAPSGIKLFIDGKLEASDESVKKGESYAAPGYWRIGFDNLGGWPDDPTSDYFQGQLDDINIYYSTEISPGDLTSLYGASVDPVNTGETLKLKANYVEGVTYSWTGPNDFTSNLQNPTIPNATAVNAGEYTVVANSGTCSTTPITVTAVVNAPLPVNLILFKANQRAGEVKLQWETAMEVNNKGFIVQRSTDGLLFENIGFVEGACTSRQVQHYTYFDKPVSFEWLYYRLQQIDFDGQIVYSKIITVKTVLISSFSFYPNPVKTKAILSWSTPLPKGTLIKIFDSKGQIILMEHLPGKEQNEYWLNLEELVPGQYYFILEKDDQVIYRSKMLKQ
ncbi:discoidin domain-containing protein [Adhaeribacter radiodurans]|uniref:Discoidin domain-containing protein n=1 Tax=Adhaeribacter radiodurans TaxID=2745197 RepID=A0A7L7LCL4_9BACT|nr:discoidin domain-containing protein [Adhaeribacter radiodurans]QMU30434.1 discoidin domain-containing protein [Adhaeribacter radiodurans]